MNTQISAENLSLITHNHTAVITTELLAKLYDTEALNIQVNFARNKDRFVEGKHFFKVVGDNLKNLRLTLSKSQNEVQISPKTRSLILWTERGAARHAKMLETDQAWEVFEKLEDCYFNQKTNASKSTPPKAKVESVNAAELLFKLNLICTTWDAARSEIAKFDPKMASYLDSTMNMFWMYTMSMKGIAGRNVSLQLSS